MIRKLKSTSGETITEVLVAALVVVLGVLLYTMMVQSSFRIINGAEEAMTNMYKAESRIEAGEARSIGPVNVTLSGIRGCASPNDFPGVTVYEDNDSDIKAYKSNR